jgi:hypothetical protein
MSAPLKKKRKKKTEYQFEAGRLGLAGHSQSSMTYVDITAAESARWFSLLGVGLGSINE